VKTTFRIFHLIKGLGRGGAETLLSEGLSFADRDRFTYGYGYFLPWKNALLHSIREKGAEVTCFECRHPAAILMSVPRLVKLFRERHIDLVHCHLPLAGVVGRLAARFCGIPVVYTEHNVMERYHPWTRRLNLWTWRQQRCVVAVSEDVKLSIEAHAGNSVPVTVVQNGIAVSSFQTSIQEGSDVRKNYSIPPEVPIVGTVAVLRKQKDFSTWLQAARLIRDRHPDAHFLIVGDGPVKNEMQLEAQTLGLSGSVHFTGIQEKVMPYLSAMDLYMNSSIFEGLPLALLEAMAMKLPVVATSVGGMPEVIQDQRTGFLVPCRAPEALAQRVSSLLSDKEMRIKFGLAGRMVVEERFSMERMMRRLEDLYLQILEKRNLVN